MSLIPPSSTALANAIRVLTMDAVERAKSGHPGMPMGMADVATVLFSKFLRFNPHQPHWPNRDRFVLSAGHGSMLLYSLLYLTGYPQMTLEEIKNFRQLGSRTEGHPEYGESPGVETTTGPLGQGLGNAVGMALAERSLRATYGAEVMDHKTVVIVGDGCLMEGISQEAISFAGHQKLSNLIVLFDDNGITIDGRTSLSTSENHIERFKACQWDTLSINGHDPHAIEHALARAYKNDRPTMIACQTVIGYGAPGKEGTEKAHGSPLGAEAIAKAREAFKWSNEPFYVPEDILHAWRHIGTRHLEAYDGWVKMLAQKPTNLQEQFWSGERGDLPQDLDTIFQRFKKETVTTTPTVATRQSSEHVLEAIVPHMPMLLGGSADLTGSNNTKTKTMTALTPEHPAGNYIYYGIREHAMGAIMNGIAVHRGFIPYGGTFLVFTDYMRPAIRLSALMRQRVIYVMTHDSIGLGEDGPTHQPIEHLASLRAIPNLSVFRPCDTIETAECWQLALESQDTPSILALTRQALPLVRTDKDIAENRSAKGAYVLVEDKNADVTLIATGSEVSLALETRKILAEQDFHVRVVSMPCTRLFDRQPTAYRQNVLGAAPRVSIEAGSPMGWSSYVGDSGLMIAMETFGASAPAKDLFKHFGFDPSVIAKKIIHHIKEGASS